MVRSEYAPLFRYELKKALKSPWFLIALGVALVLSAASAIETYMRLQDEYRQLVGFGYGLGLNAHNYPGQTREGSFGNWIVVGANAPLSGALFLYALPLLAVLPYAWSYIVEQKTGYGAQACIRADRKGYIAAKFFATFTSGALIALIPLLLNFLIVSCLFPAYFPRIEDEHTVGLFVGYIFSDLFYGHPLAYVAAYSLLDALLMGAWAMAVTGLSHFTKDRVKIMIIPYLALFAWHYLNGWIFDILQVQGFNINLLNSLRAEALQLRPDLRATLCELAALLIFGLCAARGLARREAS